MKINYKIILKALVSSIVVSIIPFAVNKDIKLFLANFVIVFVGVMFACWFIDLMYKLYELKKTYKGKKINNQYEIHRGRRRNKTMKKRTITFEKDDELNTETQDKIINILKEEKAENIEIKDSE